MDEIKNLDKQELEKRVVWYEEKYGPYIEKTGLHNWKNLFRKPTLMEWTILLMLLMAIFMAWAYERDIKLCREFLKDQETVQFNWSNDQYREDPGLSFNDSFNKITISKPES